MNRPRTVVAVHIPKTAGTSLRLALGEAFGSTLCIDDGDRPLQSSRIDRRFRALAAGAAVAARPLPPGCVVGHFLALKYVFARDRFLSVWLRDPVQRVISRYHHYLRSIEAGETSHARWGLLPGLTLEQFVQLPHYQDTMAEYLWGVGLARFDFVGLVEDWERDVERFFDAIGRPRPETPAVNRNPNAVDRVYRPSDRERALIEACNPRDVALYAAARRLALAG